MRRRSGIALGLAVCATAPLVLQGRSVEAFPPVATEWSDAHLCTYCHDAHGNANPNNLLDADLEVLCLTCHGPGGVSSHKAATHEGVTCVVCHSPHKNLDNWLGGQNLKMVGRDHGLGVAQILTPSYGLLDVVFESRGTDVGEPSLHSFSDDDEDGNLVWDGVCEVCHDPGPSQNHNFGRTCTVCHDHAAGFDAVTGSCLDCHNSPQDNGDGIPVGGRRAVVGEFDLPSHHVAGSLGDEDCKACHDMTQHQQGYVRLKDADDPDNQNLVVTLLDRPSTNSTEAQKLEPFCLACHDSDGAGGNPPFSGGEMPPVVDLSSWAASAHATQLSCYGDGVFGCHDSGHGSEKRMLLAPYGVPPVPPANEAEEEGFCFNCHDADGPAGTNVEGHFASPIRWVTGVVGDNDNLDLNDRHDVQYAAQALSGAKIECTDCHDPHLATDAAPLIPDPDPTDGRLPGTGEVLPGTTFITEWCADCHDGSYPDSVVAPDTSLHDVRASYGGDSMGYAGGSATLKPGHGWGSDDVVGCESCHTYHVSPKANLFHLVDLVLSKDGTTAIPSDSAGFDYEVTDNFVESPPVNGYEWCNTCHTASMGDKKDNCFECHYHGTRW